MVSEAERMSLLDEELLRSAEVNFDGLDEDLAAFQEDETVQAALQRGVDLKKYGSDLEAELRKAESESVAQYVEHHSRVENLYSEMAECDHVLAKMETILKGFQKDLGSISAEVRTLQGSSLSLSVRLNNRRSAAEYLHRFVENAYLPPEAVVHINSPVVNSDFVAAIVTLNTVTKYLSNMDLPTDGSSVDIPPKDTLAGRTHLPELERLTSRAILKSREYFHTQFTTTLRRPRMALHQWQTECLTKYETLFHFLTSHAPQVAMELRSTYIELLSKYVYGLFKAYQTSLLKRVIPFPSVPPPPSGSSNSFTSSTFGGQAALLGGYVNPITGEEGNISRPLLQFLHVPSNKSDHTPLLTAVSNVPISRLSQRREILSLLDTENDRSVAAVNSAARQSSSLTSNGSSHSASNSQGCSTPAVSATSTHQLPYEEVLRSIFRHLLDSSSSEYLFLLSFFQKGAQDIYEKIYGRTLQLIMDSIESQLSSCQDPVTLLIIVRMTYTWRLVMQRRRIPVLDRLFDRLPTLLWPRLKVAFEAHAKSLRLATTALPLGPGGVGAALGDGVPLPPAGGGKVVVKKLPLPEFAPHPLARRYGEFLATVLHVQTSGRSSVGDEEDDTTMAAMGLAGGGEQILRLDLITVRTEVLAILEKLASAFPSVPAQRAFFIHNLEEILRVLEVEEVHTSSSEIDELARILHRQRAMLARDLVSDALPCLDAFLNVAEAELSVEYTFVPEGASSPRPELPTLTESEAEGLSRAFSLTWKNALRTVHDQLLNFFSPRHNSGEHSASAAVAMAAATGTSQPKSGLFSWGSGSNSASGSVQNTQSAAAEISPYDLAAVNASGVSVAEMMKQVSTRLLLAYSHAQTAVKMTLPRLGQNVVSSATIMLELRRYTR